MSAIHDMVTNLLGERVETGCYPDGSRRDGGINYRGIVRAVGCGDKGIVMVIETESRNTYLTDHAKGMLLFVSIDDSHNFQSLKLLVQCPHEGCWTRMCEHPTRYMGAAELELHLKECAISNRILGNEIAPKEGAE